MGARYMTERAIRRLINAILGESPSGGGVESVTVTLTDAQIKALPSDGVEIVPAPGANKVVVPVSVAVKLDTEAGVYSDVTDASLSLMWEGGASYIYATPALRTQSFLSQAAKSFGTIPVGYLQPGSGAFSGLVTTGLEELANIENRPLVIKDDWVGLTNYTDGNAANTLKVTVYYVVVDL